MKLSYYKCFIHEADFGSSTSAALEVDDKGVVLRMVNTSKNTTNYIWDTWNNITLVGKNISELDGMEVYSDEYRSAKIVVVQPPLATTNSEGQLIIHCHDFYDEGEEGEDYDYQEACWILDCFKNIEPIEDIKQL